MARITSAPGSCCPLDPPRRGAIVQRRQRKPLDRVALTHHLRQPDRAEPLTDRAQPADGLHRRELPQVADHDHLRPHLGGVREQPLAETRRRHPRLVEHDHSARR